VGGIWIGTLFLKKGYTLGRTQPFAPAVGWVMPVMFAGLFALMLIAPQPEGADKGGVLFYSLKGPGAMHAPIFVSMIVGLIIGAIAQRSRFCTMGAFRDLILFKQIHLFSGVVALVAAAFVTNLILGQFHPGFEKQPVAHTMHLWNALGMVLAGLAFALAGGCPGRQLFLSGEGDADAGIFVIGMIVGAGFAHNFGLASSPAGTGPHGMAAVVTGLAVCLAIGFFMKPKSA
jgi:YedE family putative selenium metabolism protein